MDKERCLFFKGLPGLVVIKNVGLNDCCCVSEERLGYSFDIIYFNKRAKHLFGLCFFLKKMLQEIKFKKYRLIGESSITPNK